MSHVEITCQSSPAVPFEISKLVSIHSNVPAFIVCHVVNFTGCMDSPYNISGSSSYQTKPNPRI